MHPDDHHDGSDGFFVDRIGLVRGLLVIVTAVAVGAFVITQGLDDPDSEAVAANGAAEPSGERSVGGGTEDGTGGTLPLDVAGDVSSTDSTATTVDAADGSLVTGTTVEAIETADETSTSQTTDGPAVVTGPGETTVLVLNAAGAKGVAGRGVAVLQDLGYDTLAPKNANLLGPTEILFAAGFEEQADEVAKAFELDPAQVVAALDPSAPPINDTQDAEVIVVIGEDGLIDV